MREYIGPERRSAEDRRRKQPLRINNLILKGKRRSIRRAADREKIVALDYYSQSLFIGIAIVLGLSLLDALLTLMLLAKGAQELNPVMAYYLTHGPRVFLFVKYGLTALSVWLIVLLNDTLASRYRIGSEMVLHVFAAFFGSAVLWQLYLLSV